jgi:hypothetical protein
MLSTHPAPAAGVVDAIDGSVCPSGLRLTLLRMVDLTGSAQPLEPAAVTRDDGASDRAWPAHDDTPVAQTTVVMDHGYVIRPRRATPPRWS